MDFKGYKTKSVSYKIDEYFDMTDILKAFKPAYADFALKLFKAANEVAGYNDKPAIVSPLSAVTALAMLANGAKGETLDKLLSLFGASGRSIDEINRFCKPILRKSGSPGEITTIKTANSLWNDPEFPIFSSYSSVLKTLFKAEIHTIDLDTAVSDINAWCDRNTDGLIKNVVSEGAITQFTQMVLLNALYFKSEWKDKFDRTETEEGKFTNYDRTKSTVSYMTNSNVYAPYHKGENYSVLTINFSGDRYSMQILLPDPRVSLEKCISSLHHEDFFKWGKAPKCDVDVQIPKFSVGHTCDLGKVIKNLGYGTVFTGDFSLIANPSPIIDDIVQRTVFSIDEDGAEAASVTAIVCVGCVPRDISVRFHVNRPFLYLVKDDFTDTILFLGRITKL